MKSKPLVTSASCTSLFGVLPNGQEIHAYEISNSKGMTLNVMNYGATLVALKKTLKNGEGSHLGLIYPSFRKKNLEK